MPHPLKTAALGDHRCLTRSDSVFQSSPSRSSLHEPSETRCQLSSGGSRHRSSRLREQLSAFWAYNAAGIVSITWKALALLSLALIIPFASRRRLAVFLIEESIVVLFVLAVGIVVLLAVYVVLAVLRAGARSGFRRVAARLRGSHELGHQQANRKAMRSSSLSSKLSTEGVAHSKIQVP
jgi:hypothetical protein